MYLYAGMYILIILAFWGNLRGLKTVHNIWMDCAFGLAMLVLGGYATLYLFEFAEVWRTGTAVRLIGGVELLAALGLGAAKFMGMIRG